MGACFDSAFCGLKLHLPTSFPPLSEHPSPLLRKSSLPMRRVSVRLVWLSPWPGAESGEKDPLDRSRMPALWELKNTAPGALGRRTLLLEIPSSCP